MLPSQTTEVISFSTIQYHSCLFGIYPTPRTCAALCRDGKVFGAATEADGTPVRFIHQKTSNIIKSIMKLWDLFSVFLLLWILKKIFVQCYREMETVVLSIWWIIIFGSPDILRYRMLKDVKRCYKSVSDGKWLDLTCSGATMILLDLTSGHFLGC